MSRQAARQAEAARRAFDIRLRLALSRLHAMLAAKGRCFVSGAFVLEIPPSARVAAFLSTLVGLSARRLLARTHDGFQDPRKLLRHRLCGGRCVAGGGLRAGPQREYRFEPPLHGLCGALDQSPKGVMLFYTFQFGPKTYLYLKLESHARASVAHVRGASQRYVLKRSKRTAFETRREDAYKDLPRQTVVEAAARASLSNVQSLWPSRAADARAYDASLRTGLELFVPATVVATLFG